jgi:hypothetical protein
MSSSALAEGCTRQWTRVVVNEDVSDRIEVFRKPLPNDPPCVLRVCVRGRVRDEGNDDSP